MFAKGGLFDSFKRGMPLVFTKDLQKKIKHYGATKRKVKMTGVVAKLAVKPENAERLGVQLKRHSDNPQDLEKIKRLFREILRRKYCTNPSACTTLLGTGNKLLVEYDRFAKHSSLQGRPPLWTGLVDKDGILYGQNLMGELMMEVRGEMAQIVNK